MRQTLPLGGHAIYDRLVASRLQRFYTRLAGEMSRTGTLIDLGCGPGHLAAAAAAQQAKANLIGIDLDPRQVAIAKAHYPDIDFRVGDSRHLELPSESIRMAITTESFHHWVGQAAALKEVHRVLEPGGELWIVEGAGDMTKAEVTAWLGRKPKPGFTTISRLVFRTHGYTPRAMHEEVLPLVASSPFGGCDLERRDGWWILRCRKAASPTRPAS